MKSTTQQDLQDDNIPKLVYDEHNRRLRKWQGEQPYGYTWHHNIKQQVLRRRPELRKYLKLILLPTFGRNMHGEADNKNRNFEKNWGVSLSEVMFDYEKVLDK